MSSPRKIRFDLYEADLEAGELTRNGNKVKLTGQPFQVLVILLQRAGQVVTREELQKSLWPDTFVDADHNLNTAINKIREVLKDSSSNPRFVETLPRRGYRFVAPVEAAQDERDITIPKPADVPPEAQAPRHRLWVWAYAGIALVLFSITAGYFVYQSRSSASGRKGRILTRLTFANGLQLGATWSPDGRFIAYASNQGGKFDIWMQQVNGGDPVQVTHQPGNNWQPDWSPDGKLLVYRSEEGEGGLFVIPAIGGQGRERRISSFGYEPQWSPDGSRILFQATHFANTNDFYVVALDGEPPKPVLHEFLAGHPLNVASAAWYPDGKKISLSIWNTTPIPEFWTIPIGSEQGVKTELDSSVVAKLEEISANYSIGVEMMDFSMRWAPTADAIYFERTLRGVKNLWKMKIEGTALRGTAIEPLTTGAGADTELALSPDGKKIAFTSETVHATAWLFPFNAASGQTTGNGQALPTPGSTTTAHAITRDGSRVVLETQRNGRSELWVQSLTDPRLGPVLAADQGPLTPVWSADGKQLAYARDAPRSESQIAIWSLENHTERAVTAPSAIWKLPYDWSPDGRELLIARGTENNSRMELWAVPISAWREDRERKIAGESGYDLWQPHFSPDGRWIVFEGVKAGDSALYVIPAEGGSWTQIPPLGHWDDKPRWSPDGKTIYYVSETQGFFNVWGIHFDPSRGTPIGKPFRVTKFDSPSLMIPTYIPPVELSVTKDKLSINLAEASGSVWILENVR